MSHDHHLQSVEEPISPLHATRTFLHAPALALVFRTHCYTSSSFFLSITRVRSISHSPRSASLSQPPTLLSLAIHTRDRSIGGGSSLGENTVPLLSGLRVVLRHHHLFPCIHESCMCIKRYVHTQMYANTNHFAYVL